MSDALGLLIAAGFAAFLIFLGKKFGPDQRKMEEWTERSNAWFRVNWPITLIAIGLFFAVFGFVAWTPRGLSNLSRAYVIVGALLIGVGLVGRFQKDA